MLEGGVFDKKIIFKHIEEIQPNKVIGMNK